MISQHEKAKRWRPRFSVRTLVIVVTLVCSYLGLWEATKRQGLQDVREKVEDSRDETAYVPLVISLERSTKTAILTSGTRSFKPTFVITEWDRRRYYFWFFGYVAKLPYERDVTVEEALSRFDSPGNRGFPARQQ